MSLRSLLRKVHDNSPVPVQTAIRLMYGRVPARFKLGKEYVGYVDELMQNDKRSRQELEAMQLAKLQAIVAHAYENVPYYTRLFDSIGFKPSHLQTLQDLRHLPPITKDDLREHFEDLTAKNAALYQPEECTTGGSTGVPARFLLDRKAVVLEKACIKRHWTRAGYKEGEPTASLRGLRLAVKEGQFWVMDMGDNCLYLSSYHLSPENVELYVKAFNKQAPTLLNSYASNGGFFATLIEEAGITQVHSPRAIVCASETLYDWQRERMEKVFKTPVWDWYGLTELVGNASECEKHDGYHISMEQGLYEVVCAPDDRPAEEGETGEILATSLHNFSMPLLRYRTGDLAEHTAQPCACGRGSKRVKRIQGRTLEYVETPSGARMTATALNVHGGTWANTRQFQYVQTALDQVTLRIVKAEKYSESDEKRILTQMGERFGNEISLSVEYVQELPKTMRGKTPLIVKEMKAEQNGNGA